MTGRCKHGLNPSFCAPCQQATEEEPLPSDALRYTGDRQPVLVLRVQPGSTRVKVLRLDPRSPTATFDLSDLRVDESSSVSRRQKIIKLFLKTALFGGYLFHPERPLTVREKTEEGPAHCYHCKTELSFEKSSLGCKQCHYYVCRCARCLCGYTGRNYRGELFSQYPPLPIRREERLEFVRAVKYCTGNA
jgi:hypothetical protein